MRDGELSRWETAFVSGGEPTRVVRSLLGERLLKRAHTLLETELVGGDEVAIEPDYEEPF